MSVYLLTTYDKPILAFQTAESKTLLIQPGLLLPSSIPQGRDPKSAKTVQKNFSLELPWTQADKDPQGSTVPHCYAP